MDTFEAVQAWLRNTYNIGVSAEWLTACLEWMQQENQGLLLPMNELLSQVFEQWLLSDLSEIGEPVLPQNIVTADKCELVSNYPLQLLSLIDIGFPLYGQKQKLQGRMNPNEDVSADKPFQPAWEPKPSRMLLLQLTDGHTQIQAMEYRQITDLHQMLPSGCKVLVTGTVLCRRGLIMLTPECLQVLGGEVDALAEQNTPLANLENAMIRNREDEGKHSKKEFSGRFVSHGVDKKLDSLQKPFNTKFDQNLKNHQKGIKFDSSQVKLESYTPTTVNLKQEIGQVVQKKFEPLHLKRESDQWKDEINYDNCFDDELDLEEINALDSTSATDMTGETSVKSSFNSVPYKADSASFESNPCEKEKLPGSLTNRISGIVHPKVMNQSVTSSIYTKPLQSRDLPNMLKDDVEFFDDFEMDISYSVVPNDSPNKRHKVSETTSSKNIEHAPNSKIEKGILINKSQESKFLSKPATNGTNHRTFTSSSPLEQHNSSDSRKSSPSIRFQDIQSANTSIKPKMSSTSSVPSDGTQNVPARKNKLFRVKSGPQEIALSSGNVNRSQATKQCKLSDMFRANTSVNKTKQISFVDDDDDCSIIDGNSLPQSKQIPFDDGCSIINNDFVAHSSSMLIQKNVQTKFTPSSSSKLEDTTSNKVFTPCRDNSSSSSDCTITKCSDRKIELEQEEEDISNILPKAVIHPFPLSTGGSDSIDTENSLPFKYLSDLANMQPPASVTVKAYISTLIDKLGSNGGACWSLACRINDGTACLDVDLADNVLAELIGFSAQDSVVMRQKMKTEPRVKDILMEGLSKCQQKLINISCLMEVNAVSVTRKPVIKRLIPLSGQHVNQLIKRVEKYLCT